MIPEALPISVPVSNKTHKGKEVQGFVSESFTIEKYQGDQEICKVVSKLTLLISTKATPVLRYVPKSQRKEGDSLFKATTNKGNLLFQGLTLRHCKKT